MIPAPEASAIVFALLTGASVVAVTLLADHVGGRVGGLLATAPITTSAAHVVLALSVPPEQAPARILDGGYALLASTAGILAFFYAVKFTRGNPSPARLAAGFAAYFAVFLPGTLIIAATNAPPSVTFPVLFAAHALLAFTFMRVPVPVLADRAHAPVQRTAQDLGARFLAGALVVLTIDALIRVSPALAGALAVVPAVFIVSLAVMGVTRSAPFAARAAQAGLFGTTAVAVFVLTVAGTLASGTPGGLWIALPAGWATYAGTLTALGKLHGRMTREHAAGA